MREKKFILYVILNLVLFSPFASAEQKNKVGQSGMAYLGISMGARETAMGDAATATVKEIQGMWHNPAVLADIKRFAVSLNQVNWLAETRLYGAALAYSLGKWGTLGLDLTYMDWGEIMGTQRVDRSVNYREFILTGNINVEDYAIGMGYARRITNKFTLGFKVKRLHEDLGRAFYVVDEYEDAATGEKIRTNKTRNWKLADWGLDFGSRYDIGWNSLALAMTLQNLSRDMKYWIEEFQAPMVLRFGASMNITELLASSTDNFDLTLAVDALHPNDHTEMLNVGSELVLKHILALRAGYKFNHDVESLTFGIGLVFDYGGIEGILDYAYGAAEYFRDINRFSLQFRF